MIVNNTLYSGLRDIFDENKSIREILPYAIAKRLAYSLPITENLTELQSHFNKTHYPKIATIISKINEKIVFNVNEAIKATYYLWNTRCQLAYSPISIDFLTLLDSAKTGLIAPKTIDKLYAIKNQNEDSNQKAMALLEYVIFEEIKDE